jgi:hypothetical protein
MSSLGLITDNLYRHRNLCYDPHSLRIWTVIYAFCIPLSPFRRSLRLISRAMFIHTELTHRFSCFLRLHLHCMHRLPVASNTSQGLYRHPFGRQHGIRQISHFRTLFLFSASDNVTTFAPVAFVWTTTYVTFASSGLYTTSDTFKFSFSFSFSLA